VQVHATRTVDRVRISAAARYDVRVFRMDPGTAKAVPYT
jgi:hypothetical protein